MSEEIKNEEVSEEQKQIHEGEIVDDTQTIPQEEVEAPEQSKKEKRKASELEVIEEATVETELEMLVKMWNEYNDQLKKDQVIELYMQGIFILNRGAQQIGLELGGLQQKIKGQIQFLNYLAGKIKLIKQQYEQSTK